MTVLQKKKNYLSQHQLHSQPKTKRQVMLSVTVKCLKHAESGTFSLTFTITLHPGFIFSSVGFSQREQVMLWYKM